MKITMVQCDNPGCENTKQPESETPYRPPYAWVTAKGGLFGCGPNFSVEVCDVSCLAGAVYHAIENADD